ncbi:UbiD family decarboxylase [Chloroflexota bacterium]
MKFDSLREFIDVVEGWGELERIDGADWNLEIGVLTEMMAEIKGPVLLFDNIKDYPKGYRVLTNVFTTMKRSAIVQGLPMELTGLEMLKTYREKLRGFKPVPPVEVKSAPVKENILLGNDVDLFKFPTPFWHELDGGRFLGTGCCVITRDPETGWVNVGTYRGMLQEKDLMHVKANVGKHGRLMMDKYHAKGENCPIAISFGHDPTLWAAACDLTVKAGVSEYEFAGFMRGAPIEVVRGELTDLPIPATSEIVIEGEVPPPPFEQRVEGPFGEWTGHFTDVTVGVIPLMRVKSILHRNDPIILGVPPLKPPSPYDSAIPRAAAGVWDQIESADIPGITGVWFLDGSMYADVLVIAIKQQYAGHAKQAAVVGTACRAGTYGGRLTIVVDDDIDITNAQEVFWAVAMRSRAEDVDIIRGLWTSPADPMMDPVDRGKNNLISGRIIINACRPWDRIKDFPPVNKFSLEYREQMHNKWQHIFTKVKS